MNVCTRNTFISLWLLFGAVSLSAQAPCFYFPTLNGAVAGNNVLMPLKAVNLDSVVSMQMVIRWDPKVLKYITTDSYNFSDLSPSDLNTSRALDSGYVRLQWEGPVSAPPGSSIGDSLTIFRVRFNVIGQNADSSVVRVTELLNFPPTIFEIVKVRADASNEDYLLSECCIKDGLVRVGFTVSADEPGQNTLPVSLSPNPFLVSAELNFELDEAADTQLFITDATGRMVFEKNFFKLPAGQHGMVIENGMLGAPGVYFLTLQAGRKIAKQKFVTF